MSRTFRRKNSRPGIKETHRYILVGNNVVLRPLNASALARVRWRHHRDGCNWTATPSPQFRRRLDRMKKMAGRQTLARALGQTSPLEWDVVDETRRRDAHGNWHKWW